MSIKSFLALVLTLVAGCAHAQIEFKSPADYLKVVVQVRPSQNLNSHGSGTIISPKGYILTNWHVLASDYKDKSSPFSKSAFIYMSKTASDVPQLQYIARTEVADSKLDLAILRIISDSDGNPIRDGTVFPFARIGKVDSVEIGNRVSVWGYPAVSGATITNTVGQISGFSGEQQDTSGKRWIKTDANISRGNSGGAGFIGNFLASVPTKSQFRKNTISNDIEAFESQPWDRPAELIKELKFTVPGVIYADIPSGTASIVIAGGGAVSTSKVPSDGVARTSEQLRALLERGGTVKVAKGEYFINDPIQLAKAVTLIGSGSRSTEIVANTEGSVIFSNAEIPIKISGISIEHIEKKKSAVLKFRNSTLVDLSDVVLKGAVDDFTLWLRDVLSARFENVSAVDSGGNGFKVDGADSIFIDGSKFSKGFFEVVNKKIEIYNSEFKNISVKDSKGSIFLDELAITKSEDKAIYLKSIGSQVKINRIKIGDYVGDGIFIDGVRGGVKISDTFLENDRQKTANGASCSKAVCEFSSLTVRNLQGVVIQCQLDSSCKINNLIAENNAKQVINCLENSICEIRNLKARENGWFRNSDDPNAGYSAVRCMGSSKCQIDNFEIFTQQGRSISVGENAEFIASNGKIDIKQPAFFASSSRSILKNIDFKLDSISVQDNAVVNAENLEIKYYNYGSDFGECAVNLTGEGKFFFKSLSVIGFVSDLIDDTICQQ